MESSGRQFFRWNFFCIGKGNVREWTSLKLWQLSVTDIWMIQYKWGILHATVVCWCHLIRDESSWCAWYELSFIRNTCCERVDVSSVNFPPKKVISRCLVFSRISTAMQMNAVKLSFSFPVYAAETDEHLIYFRDWSCSAREQTTCNTSTTLLLIFSSSVVPSASAIIHIIHIIYIYLCSYESIAS